MAVSSILLAVVFVAVGVGSIEMWSPSTLFRVVVFGFAAFLFASALLDFIVAIYFDRFANRIANLS